MKNWRADPQVTALVTHSVELDRATRDVTTTYVISGAFIVAVMLALLGVPAMACVGVTMAAYQTLLVVRSARHYRLVKARNAARRAEPERGQP